ncbi:hypothetical protein HN615_05250 [Candidatus Woesearchaeota archaeon]|jgi:hypothetical protein|nr:hypothetical protein [Candidatus Woesearchaeota archaeon]
MIKNEQLELFPELINYIYESPDKGKTIYRRKFGDTHREKVESIHERTKSDTSSTRR